MVQGELVDGRFEIERHAGSGGMGDVYQALDLVTGARVALKVLRSASAQALGRFAVEANALATLRLPGVVRYVAHGATRAWEMYLAMEWLSGETLAERLARVKLSIDEAVALASRVAATLGRLHLSGIVHRDLKPSNLMLVDGDIERVTLIDFGIARFAQFEQQLSTPGAILGTPGYMAPEQARGSAEVDVRADVFALGCVLFECLTGRPPFVAPDILSLLMKVILDEPPRVRELCSDIPVVLERAVSWMLAKSPEDRPRDGNAVAAWLGTLEDTEPAASVAGLVSTRTGAKLTASERKVMCLIVAHHRVAADDATLGNDEETAMTTALRELSARYEGRLEVLHSRWMLVVLSAPIAPTDLAARAARCALALQRLLPRAPVAIVTGKAEVTSRVPVGELIERAVKLLPIGAPTAAPRIDEVTDDLLGQRFETAQDENGRWLLGARQEQDATPELLGKPTACVGREKELSTIATALDRCVAESTAAAVLVTAPAGIGKSRLRYELVRGLQERNAEVDVWLGEADPMSAGSPFGLLGQAIRRATGIVESDPLAVRQQKIRTRVARHPALAGRHTAAFIAELAGVPFSDQHDVQLRAARGDAVLMNDRMSFAWEELLRAECAARPVLLVLEDFQWGDLPTVKVIDASLKHLSGLPFMVLALGRPEVNDRFPSLWADRRVHRMNLAPLTHRASKQLVRQTLGDEIDPDLVARMIEHGGGNAFFLEELIRAVARGKGGGLPDAVLAMVQAGFEALDVETRRALRAASVFGRAFSEGGVSALLDGIEVRSSLDELERSEVITRRRGERSRDEPDYRFRHALVQQAAYEMLTESDRRLGHALAGEWLEHRGESDAITLAKHFEWGGVPARAGKAYLRAAQQALQGNDLSAAIDRAEHGVTCDPEPSLLGELRLIQAEAHLWRGDLALAEERASEAAEHLARGSAPWFSAVTQIAYAACKLGEFDRVERWMVTASSAVAMAGAQAAKVFCLCAGASALGVGGRYAPVDTLIEAVEGILSGHSAIDLKAIANLHQARAFRAMTRGDPGGCVDGLKAALAAFEEVGDRRNACTTRANVGFIYGELGDFVGAQAALAAAQKAAEQMGLQEIVTTAQASLGLVLAHSGRLDEARQVEEAAVEASRELGHPRVEVVSRSYLAIIALMTGDLDTAEREARIAAEFPSSTSPQRPMAMAIRARALLGLGRIEEAVTLAREAAAMLESLGTIEEGESLVRGTYAEALAARGDQPGADAAIAAARDNLLARAEKINHSVWRERFLHDVPDNARVLHIAHAWLQTEAK